MLRCIDQLSQLTGRNPRTITKRLEDLQYINGPKGAHLYESREALPLIYAVDNLEAARAEQARSQAALNKIREENLRKERIPIQIVLDTMDEIFQAIGATLKNCKELSPARVNELFAKFREAPKKLKW